MQKGNNCWWTERKGPYKQTWGTLVRYQQGKAATETTLFHPRKFGLQIKVSRDYVTLHCEHLEPIKFKYKVAYNVG